MLKSKSTTHSPKSTKDIAWKYLPAYLFDNADLGLGSASHVRNDAHSWYDRLILNSVTRLCWNITASTRERTQRAKERIRLRREITIIASWHSGRKYARIYCIPAVMALAGVGCSPQAHSLSHREHATNHNASCKFLVGVDKHSCSNWVHCWLTIAGHRLSIK